jgi:hypothetical protein
LIVTHPGVATLHPKLTGACKMKVVYNSLLSGWFIVRSAHQTPISGRFETREAALAHLRRRNPFHTGV